LLDSFGYCTFYIATFFISLVSITPVANNRNRKTFFMDLVKYLTVSMILFLLGIWGIFLNRKNILIMLMSIELMILAVNLNFLFFSAYLDDLIGQLFALLILTVAAAESAIGLALLVVYYRVRGTISVEFINLIKG
jgi:NADH-quinone oxidoreductase subunit K